VQALGLTIESKDIHTCAVVLQGTTEYLVLWSGYPKEAATWEALEDITNPAVRYICEQLLHSINTSTHQWHHR